MFGALARWLRGAGYDTFWQEGIPDSELIDLARENDLIVLTADTGILKRNVVVRGQVRALFVPPDLPRHKQTAYVLNTLSLRRQRPRCMACGGELAALDREEARARVPPGAFRNSERFFQCRRCGKAYWSGSHWENIDRRLRELARISHQFSG